MRETELWARLTRAVGSAYVSTWAEQTALPSIGSRTVVQALRDKIPCKTIWRAAWEWLELPDRDR